MKKKRLVVRILAVLVALSTMLMMNLVSFAGVDDGDATPDTSDTDTSVTDTIDWTDESIRPKQSETVTVEPGNSEQKESDENTESPDVSEDNPDSDSGKWDVFLDTATSTYVVTYTVQKEAEGDQVVDLTKAMDILNQYLKEKYDNDDPYNVEPGDVIHWTINIKSESGHTYKYKDGSFILSTPYLEDQADEDADIKGFDEQKLPDKYQTPNGITIKVPFRRIYEEGAEFTNALCDICVEAAIKEINNNEKTNNTIYYRKALEAFQNQNEYDDFDTFLRESYLITKDGMGDVEALVNYPNAEGIRENGMERFISNYIVANYGSWDNYVLYFFNQKYGTEYTDLNTLFIEKPEAVKIISATGNLDIAFIKCAYGSYEYDNFYRNLISFAYGDKKISEVAGDIAIKYPETAAIKIADDNYLRNEGFTDADINYFKMWDGDGIDIAATYRYVYTDGVNVGSYYYFLTEKAGQSTRRYRGLSTALDNNGVRSFYYKDAAGEKVFLAPVREEGMPRLEADNDKWSYTNKDLTVGDYMAGMLDKTGAWADANKFFNELISEGLNSDEATWVAFTMAMNLDGELTGNSFQSTVWSWYNSIVLEQIDGELNLVKVDSKGNKITSGEAAFYVWYDEDNDSQTTDDIFYCVMDADGNYGFVKYDGTSDKAQFQLKTVNGELNINYALLETMVYYLQEAVAPNGYELDNTINVICTNDQYNALLESGKIDGNGYVHKGAIDSTKPLEIKFENKEVAAPPTSTVTPPPENPEDTPDANPEGTPDGTPDNPDNPDNNPSVDPNGNSDSIDSEPNGKPEGIDEGEDDITAAPNGVKTGDSTSMIPWATAFAFTLICLIGAVLLRRKTN